MLRAQQVQVQTPSIREKAVPPDNIYDEVPFPSLPAPGAQPERLATMAAMRGLRSADVAAARVLELGCASGQNLLAAAERNPQSTFLGVDSSARQIEAARQAAAEVGLSHVEFRQLDIAELPQDLGIFDYIIAQAVYSWIDASTRDRFMAACGRHLAPSGVAYVSYNVYPGWHVHDMLRAMMRYEARDAQTTSERIAAARRFLQFLNDTLAEENPFTSTVKPPLAQVMAQSDAYLLHDHLAEVNQPVYYRHFVAHAARHGLSPLGEASFGIRTSDYLAPHIEQSLAALTPDPVEREQYRDIVRNRAIRQTLLCHQEAELVPAPKAEMLDTMYLASDVRPENEPLNFSAGQVERFTAGSGMRISTGTPQVKAALAHLGSAWPGYVSWPDLIEGAANLLKSHDNPSAAKFEEADRARLRDNLLQCAAGGIVELHRRPAPFVAAVGARPTASPLARWQVARGPVATNRRHEPIRLDDFECHLLPLLDGTRSETDLVDALAIMAAEGKLVIVDQEQVVTSVDHARRSLELAVSPALARLASHAFLVS
jgi:methyltransferase-like protein/2-polyprenyl-3-methyl-5-hydroxy-6-metoxy-1,4-benzoquinol methylase